MNLEGELLWQAVIKQAIVDATARPSKLLRDFEINAARDWFLIPNQSFDDVCDLAGKCPLTVRKAAIQLIENTATKVKYGRTYSYEGQTLSVRKWAKLKGLGATDLYGRLALGWTLDRALNTPTRTRKKAAQTKHAERNGIRGVGPNLPETPWDRRGCNAHTISEIEFSKIKEPTE